MGNGWDETRWKRKKGRAEREKGRGRRKRESTANDYHFMPRASLVGLFLPTNPKLATSSILLWFLLLQNVRLHFLNVAKCFHSSISICVLYAILHYLSLCIGLIDERDAIDAFQCCIVASQCRLCFLPEWVYWLISFRTTLPLLETAHHQSKFP